MSTETVYICDWCGRETRDDDDVDRWWVDVHGKLLCRPCYNERAKALSGVEAACKTRGVVPHTNQ